MIGNKDILMQIQIAAVAAVRTNSAVPHMLFSGTPGCGKTTTAKLVSQITNYPLIEVMVDSLTNLKDVRKLFLQLPLDGYDHTGKKIGKIKPVILFIDEIHGLSTKVQEILGIAMEEWKLPVQSEISNFVPEFTLIGATTSEGKLTVPFLERFKMVFYFKPYTVEESIDIVKYHALNTFKMNITDDAAKEIALRGRGIPRILVSLLRRVRDFSIAMNKTTIEKELAIACFSIMKVNEDGLTEHDLDLLYNLFKINAPVGIDNLAMMTGIPKGNLMSLERYLIQKGLIMRAPRGREITREGLKYLAKQGRISEMELHQAMMERFE